MEPDSDLPEHFPVIDAMDHEILMHRDAHFGGLFSEMLEYYRKEGRGIHPEFNVSHIEKLAELEKQLKQNLAPLFLTAEEAQKIADTRSAYKKLRAIYEVQKVQTYIPKLIADLILSEEEEPEAEIQALVQEKQASVPYLIDILRQEEYYDSLSPGYGLAPVLAAKCLGLIGDKRALISLFEALGQGDFDSDEQLLKAFKAIGLPARDFLLKVVQGRPLNEDNERAAIGLIAFKDDPIVPQTCLDLLEQKDVLRDPCLSTYLLLVCAGLNSVEDRQRFNATTALPAFPKTLREDVRAIRQEWQQP